MYPPLSVLATHPGDEFDEEAFTFQYMSEFGVDHVRGGSYQSVKLNPTSLAEAIVRVRIYQTRRDYVDNTRSRKGKMSYDAFHQMRYIQYRMLEYQRDHNPPTRTFPIDRQWDSVDIAVAYWVLSQWVKEETFTVVAKYVIIHQRDTLVIAPVLVIQSSHGEVITFSRGLIEEAPRRIFSDTLPEHRWRKQSIRDRIAEFDGCFGALQVFKQLRTTALAMTKKEWAPSGPVERSYFENMLQLFAPETFYQTVKEFSATVIKHLT